MKRLLVLATSALMLSGCIAEWKNPNGPQKWDDQTGPSTENTASGQASGNPIHP